MYWKVPYTNIVIGKEKTVLAPITQEQAKPVEHPEITLPTRSGRSSEAETGDLLTFFNDEVAIVTPDFELKLLEALEYLAKYNADLSYAVDNVVQLGSTPYKIFFDESVGDKQAAEMLNHIKMVSKKWYTGGLQSLRGDLLAQLTLMGVISAEKVPNLSLNGIENVVLVHPKNIKFVYKEKENKYMPYQVTQRLPVMGSPSTLGLRELNPITYSYLPIRRFNEKPYGIPPFLSALENIAIEKSMLDNFRSIVKRIGVFGFLHVYLRKPTMNVEGGETIPQYEARVSNYINAAAIEAEKGMSKGVVVGIDGDHRFEVSGQPGNATGAKQLFEMNSQMKMSGLKQDPLMLGRNFSTSEAVGRVLLVKLSAQIANFQRVVDNFMADVILMELLMAGYKLENVEVESEKPMLGDEYKDQQAYQVKALVNQQLYKDGIISQQDYANNMGYDEPAEEEPRAVPEVSNPNTQNPDAPSSNSNSGTDVTENQAQFSIELCEEELSQGWPVFEYGHSHGEPISFEAYYSGPYKMNKLTNLMGKYIDDYYNGTRQVYEKAVQKAATRIGNLLLKTSSNATLQQVTDKVISSLYTHWSSDFSEPQRKVINKWVSSAYKAFRKDKAVFNGATTIAGKKVPEATFGVTDLRTLEYYKKSDGVYLGRFITDADTKKKITQFIKDKYINDGLPIDNKAILTEFKAAFGDMLMLEDYKISRIINTSIANMKDIAGLNYMQQAGVEKFKRVEILDQLTCDWCRNMNGRVFTVSLATERFDKISQADPLTIKQVSPFITSVYKDPAELTKLTSEQLQAAGVEVGAYHPHCRGAAVADI